MVTRMETMTIKPRITLDLENDAWKEYHAAKFVEPLLIAHAETRTGVNPRRPFLMVRPNLK